VRLRTTLLAVFVLLVPATAQARFGPVGEVPVAGRLLAGTASGGVLVADGGRLRRYDADWTRSLDVPLGDAADAAAGPTGLIYMTDPETDLVRVLSADGRQVGTLGAEEMDDPRSIAAGPDGRVAVGDATGVTRFGIDGSVMGRTDLPEAPADVALDGRGTVFAIGPDGRIVADPLPGAPYQVRDFTAAAIAVDEHDRLWAAATAGGLVRFGTGGRRREIVCSSTSAVSLAAAAERLVADEAILGPDSAAPCVAAGISLRDVTLTRTRWGGVRVGFRLAEPAFVRVRIVRPRLAVHQIGRFMQKGRRHISLDSVTNRAGEERLLHDRVTVRVHAESGLRRSREITRSLPPG
jgi:hypothetical protein